MGVRVAFISVCYSLLLNLFVLTNAQLQDYYYFIITITTLIELWLFSFLFYHIIKSIQFKRFIVIITALCSLYFIYSSWKSSENSFDSESSAISFLIIMGYCIFYLYERVKDTQDPFFYSSPTFLVIVSIIVYSAGTFFPFIYARYYMNTDNSFKNEFDLIHDTLYVIKNIILCFAILTQNKINPNPKYKNQNKSSFNPR